MVVQHNLASMNASRMLGITTGQQAKSSEKLASGYRINRAADDAAGLSISEKMRKQIKGLDRSSINAQDGVSSVQTAEGALAEVHSMLQRMNELSIQAANGTNSKDDRDAIQSEIAQLSTEIDRVSETTKFNETYLLKGDAPLTRHYPKAHDAGLKGTLTDLPTTGSFEIPTFWPGDKMNIGGIEYTIGSSKEDAEELIRKAVADVDKHFENATHANVKKEEYLAQVTTFEEARVYAEEQRRDALQNNNQTMATAWRNSSTNYTNYKNAANALATAYRQLESSSQNSIESQTITIGDKYYKPTYDTTSNPVALTWTEYPSGTRIANFPDQILPVPSAVEVTYEAGSALTNNDQMVKDASDNAIAMARAAKTSANNAEAQYRKTTTGYIDQYNVGLNTTYTYDKLGDAYKDIEERYAGLINGDEILIGEKTYRAEYTPNTNPAVTWTEYFSGNTTNNLAGEEVPVKASARVYYESLRLNIMTDQNPTDEGDGVDDNDPKLVTKTKAYEYIQRELTTANNIGTPDQKAVVNFELTETDILDRKARFYIEKGFAEVNSNLSFGLHVGSDADMTNKIQVDIAAMNTANLGLKGIDISDDTGLAATYAVDAITDALAILSEQRSSLGAIQNRLEHTILNLDNVVENTTEAESRIRDTDMAEAMVEYSKNNILAQAGQAMLAQANSSTEGVLSLLQ